MIPRLNHCDLACKSKTSSNRFRADVKAGYSDDCCEIKNFKTFSTVLQLDFQKMSQKFTQNENCESQCNPKNYCFYNVPLNEWAQHPKMTSPS